MEVEAEENYESLFISARAQLFFKMHLFMYLFGKSGSEWWLSNINEMHSPDALVLFKCYVFPVSCPLLCSHCAFEKHYYFAINSEDSIFLFSLLLHLYRACCVLYWNYGMNSKVICARLLVAVEWIKRYIKWIHYPVGLL